MATRKIEIMGSSASSSPRSGQSADNDAEFSAEEESKIVSRLQEINFSMKRLLDTMDTNLSLLEGSVREIRTAHEIVAESNRMARRQRLRGSSPSIMVTTK